MATGQDCTGGGTFSRYAYVPLGCTIVSNHAGLSGGGSCFDGEDFEIYNCVYWGNTASSGPQISLSDAESTDDNELLLRYSSVQGERSGIYVSGNSTLTWGEGNIEADPLFLALPDDGGDGWGDRSDTPDIDEGLNDYYGDLHLSRTSPCINAGNPLASYTGQLDIDGQRRVFAGRVDIGADEYIDFDHEFDGDLDLVDFSAMASHWMAIDCQAPDHCDSADVNHDTNVNFADLLYVSDNWLDGAFYTGPLAHLQFERTYGWMLFDSSLKHNDARLISGNLSPWIESRNGKALLFDGVDDSVRMDGVKGIGGGHSRTVCAWIRTTDTDGQIISWGATAIPGGRWVLRTETYGHLRLEVGGGAIVGSTQICNDRWHHVAAVLEDDGSPNINEIRLYVDGQSDPPSSVSDRQINTIIDGAPDVRIASYGPSASFFQGIVDEVLIYDRALRQSEIEGLASLANQTLGYWALDEGRGQRASDSSQNYLDCFMSNMAENAWVDGKKGTALLFDGIDDALVVPEFKGVTQTCSRTSSAWVKTDTAGGTIMAWGKTGIPGGKWVFCTNALGQLRLEVGGGAIEASTDICDGLWHHVAAVYEYDDSPNVTDVRLYVDGTRETVSNVVARDISTQSDSDFLIGNSHDGNKGFKGIIDEVRVYDVALIRREIRDLVGFLVRAGRDRSVGIGFNGTVSIALEGRIVGGTDTTEIEWSVVSGPSQVLLDDATDLNAAVQFEEKGVYVLRLTACEGSKCAFDEVVITVQEGVPAGHWQFNEGTGAIALDSSGNGHDGTLLNMDESDWVSGKDGTALDFDGVGDRVQIYGYKGIEGDVSRTVCAWIRTTDTKGEIVSWGPNAMPGGRWVILTESNGHLRVEVGGGSIVGSTLVCDGAWHHVAAVLENDGSPNVGEIRLYVDGVRDAPSSIGDQAIDTVLGPDVKIGLWGGGQGYFEGIIDDVRIYDRALSAEEISELAL